MVARRATDAATPRHDAPSSPAVSGGFKAMGVALAQAEAVKTGQAVDAKSIFVLPARSLVEYDNPRHEPANCYEHGFTLIGDPDVEQPEFDTKGRCLKFVSLLHLLTSDNLQKLDYGIEIVTQYEAVDRSLEENADRPQTIPELGEEIRLFGQWVPVHVKRTTRGVVMGDGARRLCGILLEHAKDKAKILRGDSDAPKEPFPATVQATDLECAEDDLFIVSAKINLARKGFTELQEGRVYHEMLKRTNPKTVKGGELYEEKYPDGRRYTKKEAAAELHVPYSTFRNREALWHDYRVAKGVRYGLTDEERRKIALGEMLPTYASRLSLGESVRNVSRNGGTRIKKKHLPLTLREMEALFDATPSDQRERRAAIAECMRKTYDQALRESRERIDSGMEEMEAGRGNKRKGRRRVAA